MSQAKEEISDVMTYSELTSHKPKIIYGLIKRIGDILASSIGLIILMPLFLIVALIMKCSEPTAPIFFSHTRNGKKGKKFKMYKFRTMCQDAESILMKDTALFEKFKANGYKLETHEDPRVTKVGAFLRKTSIDELPQLINVCLGQMSLVGPRPIPDREILEYGSDKQKFLSVKPGITGWWQVSGRSNICYPERCDFELHYVDKNSLGFDILILFKTIGIVLKRHGAH
ncbi:sugar transferase [Lactococcus lactis]|uniref:sugar transferase n=1 Tax=Lactococcus lactis TaxID=1358 RepID=UPI0028909371|nr:sugar transferase [Lactococcus lactis]MDT2858453.1 sugar transferase [Lactococcus lactis]